MPELDPLVHGGLVTVERVEVRVYRSKPQAAGSSEGG